MSPEREEVPGSQCCRQTTGPPFLQYVDDDDDYQHDNQRYTHTHQNLPTCQRQAEDKERQNKEAADDVDCCKPAVGGRDVAQAFSQSDRDAGEGDWIPQNDARDVEQEVHEGNLSKVQSDGKIKDCNIDIDQFSSQCFWWKNRIQ